MPTNIFNANHYLDDDSEDYRGNPRTKPKHIHDYQYVGAVGNDVDEVMSPKELEMFTIQGYKFVCPISGCSKPVKVVKER